MVSSSESLQGDFSPECPLSCVVINMQAIFLCYLTTCVYMKNVPVFICENGCFLRSLSLAL